MFYNVNITCHYHILYNNILAFKFIEDAYKQRKIQLYVARYWISIWDYDPQIVNKMSLKLRTHFGNAIPDVLLREQFQLESPDFRSRSNK